MAPRTQVQIWRHSGSPGSGAPLSQKSTAFNLDFYGAVLRHYYEGCTSWMNSQPGHVGTYAAGDIWGSIGAWYSGNWHDSGAESYISQVKTELGARRWEKPGF